MSETLRCYFVDEDKHGAIREIPRDSLPEGDVLIRGRYSSLNYKDALGATGHPGVARNLPHIPGVDVAGSVAWSNSDKFAEGDEVFVTGYELGAPRWGGWAELVSVPAEWVVPLPAAFSLRDIMVLGTAGFTAAQGVASLQLHGITPDRGEVLVTGASGGVGSIAVSILARLGYTVVAMTGKASARERLLEWGAARVVDRDEIEFNASKPLLTARWAGAIDTVGGPVLATLIKQLGHRGCVATCGSVAGVELSLTVFPFILRGVKLDGIDSAMCPWDERLRIWQHLATDWMPRELGSFASEVALSDIAASVERILNGQLIGRTVIDLQR